MLKCKVCGKPLSATAKSCPGCGDGDPVYWKQQRRLSYLTSFPGLVLYGVLMVPILLTFTPGRAPVWIPTAVFVLLGIVYGCIIDGFFESVRRKRESLVIDEGSESGERVMNPLVDHQSQRKANGLIPFLKRGNAQHDAILRLIFWLAVGAGLLQYENGWWPIWIVFFPLASLLIWYLWRSQNALD